MLQSILSQICDNRHLNNTLVDCVTSFIDAVFTPVLLFDDTRSTSMTQSLKNKIISSVHVDDVQLFLITTRDMVLKLKWVWHNILPFHSTQLSRPQELGHIPEVCII